MTGKCISDRNAVGIGKRVQDRQAHIGDRKLGKNAAIHELDHGVNRGLRMHDDLHLAPAAS